MLLFEQETYITLCNGWMHCQMVDILFQGIASHFHKLIAGSLTLYRILFRTRRYEVAPMSHLQQLCQGLQAN